LARSMTSLALHKSGFGIGFCHFTAFTDDRSGAGIAFPAATVAAGAQFAAGDGYHMTDFTGNAVRAGEYLAVDDYTAAYAGTQCDKYTVF